MKQRERLSMPPDGRDCIVQPEIGHFLGRVGRCLASTRYAAAANIFRKAVVLWIGNCNIGLCAQLPGQAHIQGRFKAASRLLPDKQGPGSWRSRLRNGNFFCARCGRR